MTAVTGDFFKLPCTFLLAPIQPQEAELSCPGPTSTNRLVATDAAKPLWLLLGGCQRTERTGMREKGAIEGKNTKQ